MWEERSSRLLPLRGLCLCLCLFHSAPLVSSSLMRSSEASFTALGVALRREEPSHFGDVEYRLSSAVLGYRSSQFDYRRVYRRVIELRGHRGGRRLSRLRLGSDHPGHAPALLTYTVRKQLEIPDFSWKFTTCIQSGEKQN